MGAGRRRDKIVLLTIAIVTIAGLAAVIVHGEYRARQGRAWLQVDEAACRRAMAAIGDVSLDDKTHDELVAIFGQPCKVSEPGPDSGITNSLRVYWWGDAIEVVYPATHLDDVTGGCRPIKWVVRRSFKGSLGGVRLGEPTEAFMATSRPGADILTNEYPQGSRARRYGRSVDVSGELHMERRGDPWWTTCTAKDGRIVEIEHWDTRWELRYGG